MILPEELLHEIFAWAFYSPVDDAFLVSCPKHYTSRSTHIISHHVLCKPPPAQLLLVCRKWYRVGTPSLYSTVTLHTNAQLRQLAETLQSTPSRGPMIRHLRLDGCYDRPLHAVAKLTPNVRIVSLHLYILSQQQKVGLQKALPLWNITDLFLHYQGSRSNQRSTELSLVVARAMKEWTHKSLVSVKVSCYPCLFASPYKSNLVQKRIVMAGGSWLFNDWFRTPSVAECFDSATCPYEIASSPDILETLFRSGLLSHIVEEGNISRITCFDFEGHLHKGTFLDSQSCAPESIKRLINHKESALQYLKRQLYVHIMFWEIWNTSDLILFIFQPCDDDF
jgi:hypothetical protein